MLDAKVGKNGQSEVVRSGALQKRQGHEWGSLLCAPYGVVCFGIQLTKLALLLWRSRMAHRLPSKQPVPSSTLGPRTYELDQEQKGLDPNLLTCT